uniref:Uncharacterized protein n=1 Tax=Arundo donax TaxID=35708 RepID=A0A0A8Y3P7_ARUDO
MTPSFYHEHPSYKAQPRRSQTAVYRYPCPAPLPSSLPPLPPPHLSGLRIKRLTCGMYWVGL